MKPGVVSGQWIEWEVEDSHDFDIYLYALGETDDIVDATKSLRRLGVDFDVNSGHITLEYGWAGVPEDEPDRLLRCTETGETLSGELCTHVRRVTFAHYISEITI